MSPVYGIFFKQKVAVKALKVPKMKRKKLLTSVQKCRKFFFKVSVLLSAHAERVGVSRLQDFFLLSRHCPINKLINYAKIRYKGTKTQRYKDTKIHR